MAAALGVHTLTVATCLTVQNRHGFQSIEPVAIATVRASLVAALEDGTVHAVKIGLVPGPSLLELAIDLCTTSLSGVRTQRSTTRPSSG